jgi:hypothetical protein
VRFGWVIIFAAVAMLISSVPYLIGFASQGKDWAFTGFVFGVEDGNSYLAKMLGGWSGAWTFLTPYTAYPQKGVAAFMPYLLMGKIAAPPGLHEQLAALFHLFRVASGILAILATYDFLSYILRREALRRFGLVLAVFGGGLGWVLVLLEKGGWLGSLPLEFFSPETFGFLGLFGVPHLALARAALLWGLLAYFKSAQVIRRSPKSPRRRFLSRMGIKIGLFWLLAALAQPLTALVFGGLIALHLAAMAFWLGWRQSSPYYQVGFVWPLRAPIRAWGLKSLRASKHWEKWKSTFLLALCGAVLPGPFLLYNTLAFSLDPFLKAWTAQNRILSPHPLHYLLAYGLLAPFALIGARRLSKRRPWEGTFFIAWVCALPFLAYAPVNLQRRLPEGIWVAIVVLALAAFDGRRSGKLEIGCRLKERIPKVLYLLLMTFPSALLLLSGGILAALRPCEPVFRPAQEVNAFQFLQANAGRGEVVLSSFETGNALPAWAPLRTVIGHGPESVNLAGLQPRVARFYNRETPNRERLDFLSEFDVSYVFFGPHERSMGDWNPEGAPFLEPIYTSTGYQIYKVHLKLNLNPPDAVRTCMQTAKCHCFAKTARNDTHQRASIQTLAVQSPISNLQSPCIALASPPFISH